MRSEPRIPDIDAAFFDAGFTILLPSDPIPLVYRREAESLGLDLPPEFDEHMSRLWSERMTRREMDSDLVSSDEMERESWRRVTLDLAEPFPGLKALHAPWLDRLFAWFDSASAWKVEPGCIGILEHLRNRGVTLGVVSNWHSSLHGILHALNLHDRFDFVLTSGEVGFRKPHPGIFEAALKKAGTEADRAMHVGDSERDDVMGARRLGITPVLIGSSNSLNDPDLIRVQGLQELQAMC